MNVTLRLYQVIFAYLAACFLSFKGKVLVQQGYTCGWDCKHSAHFGLLYDSLSQRDNLVIVNLTVILKG